MNKMLLCYEGLKKMSDAYEKYIFRRQTYGYIRYFYEI